MPQTYKEAILREDDEIWTRLEKLYVRICGVGDEIYSSGSGVGVLHKRIDGLEASVFALRKDCDEIRRMLFDRGKSKCQCGDTLRVGHYKDCANAESSQERDS